MTLIDKLLTHGMSIDLLDKYQRPPLFEAGDMATLRHLLDKGAKVPADALFRLRLEADSPIRREAYELLMSKGADVKALNQDGHSLLTAKYLAGKDPGVVELAAQSGCRRRNRRPVGHLSPEGRGRESVYDRVALPKMLKEPAVTITLAGTWIRGVGREGGER